jgi:transcriptional/translational regulatory protein YebC/TACO1
MLPRLSPTTLFPHPHPHLNPQVGFSVAASGSVLFNFEKKARLCLTTEIDEDSMIEVAMEADVDDCELEAPNEDKVQTLFNKNLTR